MTGSKRLLLIEDSPTQAAQFRFHFEKLGYTVEVAGDAEEGLKQLARTLPDLIVLDLMLPGRINGLTLCQELKKPSNTATNTIPILMFSGENKLQLMSQAYSAGADYYVVKAHDGYKTLQNLIDVALARRDRKARQAAISSRVFGAKAS